MLVKRKKREKNEKKFFLHHILPSARKLALNFVMVPDNAKSAKTVMIELF